MINDLELRGVYSRKDGKLKALLKRDVNNIVSLADARAVGGGGLMYLLTAEIEDDLFNIIAEEADLASYGVLKEISDNGIINLKALSATTMEIIEAHILTDKKIDIDSL